MACGGDVRTSAGGVVVGGFFMVLVAAYTFQDDRTCIQGYIET